MSIQITFTNISINCEILAQNSQSLHFQLQILTKQYKENMKTNIHTIKRGLIDLPQNIFILPYNGVINVRIEQKNDEKLINKVLQLGEHKFILNQLTISKIKQKQIQQGFIQFFTFSKNFKIQINYKAIIKSNTIFAGHFHGILKNQGIQTLSILNIQKYNKQNDNYQLSQQELQKYAQVPKSTIKSKIGFKEKFTNFLHLCNQVQESEIAQEYLPHKFDEDLKNKLKTPFNSKLMSEKNEKYYTENSIKSKLHIQTHGKQLQILNKKEKDLKPLFSGACQSKNLFSCFDEHVEEQQICIIEPIYRK